jgi:UDP-glucose:(heptosyl)LPS alpha-1,3-glucosyltransferase
MKIVFVRANKTKYGGAENYLSRVCQVLDKRGVAFEIRNSPVPKFFPSWMRALLFNFYACLKKNDHFYFSLERITCPDIYRAGDGVHKVFLTTKKRKFNPLNPVYLYLEKKTFHNAKKIIANSHFIKQQIIETYGITESKIDVIYNGIVHKAFDKQLAKKQLQDEFSIDNIPIITFVGNGFERKGLHTFLTILSHIKNDFHAFIIGKDKKMHHYRQLAEDLELSDKVTFTYERSDVDHFYAASDVFLFPTNYEPFSNVVLEAMSFQNIVFTTNQNGASEILNPAFVLEGEYIQHCANQIDTIFKDPVTMQQLQHENYELSKRYTIEQNVQQTLEVIDAYID